ncbi:MAG: Pr6Pr family membrane protein [Ahrensia sp.]
MHHYNAGARRLAGFIAMIAFVTLCLRVYLTAVELGGVGAALVQLSQFFTILTNTLVAVGMGMIALGYAVPKRAMRALVVSIVCVGLVYHALLAHLVDFTGLAMVADHGLHTFVPIAMFVWWVLFLSRPAFVRSDIALWMVLPLSYSFYALGRAQWSAFYPYPFLDLATLGWPRLAANMVGLALAFICVGFVLVLLERLARRVQPQ